MRLRTVLAAAAMILAAVPAKAEIVNAASYQVLDNWTGNVAYFIDVTVTVDNLEIDGISVNRGNCSWAAPQMAALPVNARFGEKFTIRTSCAPLELVIYSKGNTAVSVKWY
jgi:hypothetical protein